MWNGSQVQHFGNQKSISTLSIMLRAMAVLACACLMTVAAHAQYRASIQGVVTDPTGAVVPGATVTLTDTGTNHVLTSITSNRGIYTFNALPPSRFTLTVEATGFKQKTLTDVEIIPEQANAVNVQLDLGQSSQTVNVNGLQATLLQTETASISGTITSNQIQHMPAFGREVFQLAQLAPGVFGDAAQSAGGGTSNLPGTYIGGPGATGSIFATENAPQIVANGIQNTANGVTIDGIGTSSAIWGGTTVITPSEDSIANVKIVSNSYDAENSRYMGAQIQVTTKSGTNDLHGSLFFLAVRPGLNAYQSYNGPTSVGPGTAAERGLQRDQSRFNNFGGSIGGPIWKNKIFAFFNYETLRNNTSVTEPGWYDTSEFDTMAPSGSIAAKFLTYPGAGVTSSGQISVTCQDAGLTEGVGCRTIPGQGLDIGSPLKGPLGSQDLSYVSSGQPGVGGGLDGIADIGEYNTSNPNNTTDSQYYGRLDGNVTGKDRLTYTMFWVPQYNAAYSGPVRAYNLSYTDAINDAFAVIWDHTFSPTLFNEARVNAAGWRWNEIASNPQSPFGLPQDEINGIGNLSTYSSPSQTYNFFGVPGPTVFDQWTYGYQDVMTKVAGPHNIKFGGGLTRLYYLNEAPYNSRPTYTFYNIWDFLNDAPEAESGVFNPITGIPTIHRQDNREDLWSFFVQDDYKVRTNLTLNLGLRWSYFGPMSSKEGNLSVVELGPGSAALTGMKMRVGGNLYTAQKGNFGPQFGFAWSPTQNQGRFVVRGGFGLSFTEEEIAATANGGTNPPTVLPVNFGSASPTQINPAIVYSVATPLTSLINYPPNPNTQVTFNPTTNLPLSAQTSVTGFPYPVLPQPYSYHYSLDTQYDLGHAWVATLGYQGSIGRHLSVEYNENALGAGLGWTLNPVVSSATQYSNEGHSNYNAMLAELKHQFSHTFLADVQYTWSKSMDNGSQPQEYMNYPYLPNFAYWGRSDYNIQNAFKLFGMWQPVFIHGGSSVVKALADGWSLSGILNLHTGFPWTPWYTNIAGGGDLYAGSGYNRLLPGAYLGGAGSDTSNKAFESGPVGSNQSTFNKNYPNGALAYFTIPQYTPVTAPFPATFAPPQNPGVARNSLNGPNYRDVDMTLAKTFVLPKMRGLGDSAGLEIRADAFNLFNNVNLNNIQSSITTGTDTSNPSFGQAQSALASRMIDLQARFSF